MLKGRCMFEMGVLVKAITESDLERRKVGGREETNCRVLDKKDAGYTRK